MKIKSRTGGSLSCDDRSIGLRFAQRGDGANGGRRDSTHEQPDRLVRRRAGEETLGFRTERIRGVDPENNQGNANGQQG